MRPRERVTFFLASLVFALAMSATFWRALRGIDFTDEAFYLALPVRFALGDRPFVDELNIAQTSGLLLYPFVKLHVLVRGTTGIFLFIRVLYVAFFALVAWAAYQLGATRLPRHAALVAAAPCVAYVPWGLPDLSYNTLGSGLFALGLFVVTRALIDPPLDPPKPHKDPLMWGGFALGAAAFAYPSVVLGAVAATAAVFVLAAGRRVRAALRVAAGGALFGLVILPVVAAAGPRHVKEVLAYSSGGISTSSGKLDALFTQFQAQHPQLSTLAVAAAVALALSRRWPRLVLLGLPMLPLLARGSLVQPLTVSMAYVCCFALLAPLFAIALRDTRVARMTVVAVWLPSAVTGVATAYTSGTGSTAAAVGLFPAAIVTGILLTMWIVEITRRFSWTPLRDLFGFAPVVLVWVFVKMVLADDCVYRDGHLPLLTARMTSGPYKGLYTTPARKLSLDRMTADILAQRKTERALFYYDFPAGYIIAQQRPLVSSAWIFPMEPRMTMDSSSFMRKAQPGDVVYRIDGGWNPKLNALDRAVEARCDLVGRREGYTVYVVR